MTKTVVSKECRFATYVPPPEHGKPDMHVVKEILHYADGTTAPNLHFINDYKRDFWVTRDGAKNHQQKKEWEKVDNVLHGMATQTELCTAAARMLKQPWFKGTLRDLAESPYLYGVDISSTSILKQAYRDKYPVQMTNHSVATFDTETDVVNGTEEIIMATFTFKNICHTAVTKGFVEGITSLEDRVNFAMNKYLGETVEKRGLICTLEVVENSAEVVRSCFKMAHKHKPDFVAIWNIDFDINKVLHACQLHQVDPKDIFSDPSVPPDYRFFKYKQGKKQKVTASGKVTPIKPAAQWHVATAPASFMLMDAMCVYKQVRTGKPEEQSYSLDAILAANKLGIQKLKFEEADGVTGLRWHQLMQQKFKIEYIIYNRFDCIAMEILDEKTQDLAASMPVFSGASDFSTFNSQPKRTIDRLHFYVQTKGLVMASTAAEMKDDDDEETVDLGGWIIMLPAELVHDNGLKIILEDAGLSTNIRMHVADLDVSASYPNGECTINISKETTRKELIAVEGIHEETMRMQGINLTGAQTNAAEFCQTVFNCPQFFDMLNLFNERLSLPPDTIQMALRQESPQLQATFLHELPGIMEDLKEAVEAETA